MSEVRFVIDDGLVQDTWSRTGVTSIPEIRLAQLALDPNNSPGWDVLEQERSISTKMPLYVKSMQVFHAPKHQAELNCGCSYSLMVQTPTRAQRTAPCGRSGSTLDRHCGWVVTLR